MENTAPKPFVFVLMPFDKAFDDIYQLGIKPACVDAGAYCERVDEQIYEESMLQRIYNQISKTDIVVADMSTRNPNVFYETGYAHALGKRVILLTQDAKDIPFDLKHYPHIIYSNISELKNELNKRVKWFANNPTKSSKMPERFLVFYFNDTRIEDGSILSVNLIDYSTTYGGNLIRPDIKHKLTINNPTSVTFDPDTYKIALQTPKSFNYYSFDMENVTEFDTPNTRMHYLPTNARLYPSDWTLINIQLIPTVTIKENARVDFGLSTFSELGRKEIRFFIDFKILQPTDLTEYIKP